jgi:hypothetical protein
MNKTIRHPATAAPRPSAGHADDVQRSTTDQIMDRCQAIASPDSILAKKVLDDSPAKTEKTKEQRAGTLRSEIQAGESQFLSRSRRAGDKNARRISQNLLLNLVFTCQRARKTRRAKQKLAR